jgi:hypothetical protein
MSTEVSQALRDAENALRDFISHVLSGQFGSDWEVRSGVTAERIAKWRERKEAEGKRQATGALDERLIYYADFYDLRTILKKHWAHFAPALGELRTLEVWLTELEGVRNPDAHRRELLPHQRDLVSGISGEIRTRIARYRSTLETRDSYYPRIEFAADNLGNSWKLGDGENRWVSTNTILRPGDMLELVVTATDPLGDDIEYLGTFQRGSPGHSSAWSRESTFKFRVTEQHIGKLVFAQVEIRSRRKHHAHESYDDNVMFSYEVLPPRRS